MTEPTSGRRQYGRLLVSLDTAQAVDDAVIRAITESQRKVAKTDLADALVRVGLAHFGEVTSLLRSESGS